MFPWTIPAHYLFWHYFFSWRDFFRLYRDWLWFLSNFFSLSLLLRTLFSPFRRLREDYPRGPDFVSIVSAFVVNTLMRLIGLALRLCLLIFGGIVAVFFVLAAPFLFVFWLILPPLASVSFLVGFYLIFR